MGNQTGSIQVGVLGSCGGILIGLISTIVFGMWFGWKAGLTAGLVALAIGHLVAFVGLARVKELSWGIVSIPLILSGLYFIFPLDFPGPIDDFAVLTTGAISSLGLAAVKQMGVKPRLFQAAQGRIPLAQGKPAFPDPPPGSPEKAPASREA